MTSSEPAWRGLIPHRGAMCLLGRVLAYDDESIHATATSHRDPGNPLRSGGMLRAVHLCEYGAQATAVHGGLLMRARGGEAGAGVLVALRAVELFVSRVDDMPGHLDIHAARLLDGGTSWQYAFRIEHGRTLLARGRAAVMHGPA